jgi:hypothetical protein
MVSFFAFSLITILITILYYYQIDQANSLEKAVLSGSQLSSFTSARSEIRRWTWLQGTHRGNKGPTGPRWKMGGGP